MIIKEVADILSYIQVKAGLNGYKAYVVGGFVRDFVEGKDSNDIDILIDKDGDDNPAISFVNLIADDEECSGKAIYETFGVGKLDILGYKVEFVMPRAEKYNEDSRNPEVKKIDVKSDALRRDFTINTLMLDLKTREVLDPTGRGIADIKSKVIRSANPDVDQMIYDDPLRMLRAIRFMVQKDFVIDTELLEAITKNKERISVISNERIREELNKILLADKPSKAFKILGAVGLLQIILPEVCELTKCKEYPPHHWAESSYEHTMRVVDNIRPELHMRLAGLLHDIGKPDTFSWDEEKQVAHYYDHHMVGLSKVKSIMERLKYSNAEIKIVRKLVLEHMRPHFYNKRWKDKSIRKFVADMGDLREDVIQLVEADCLGASGEEHVQKNMDNLQAFRDRIDKVLNTPDMPIKVKPILTGNDFMEIYSREGGVWIKDLIDYTIELQMENPQITKEQVIEKINGAGVDKIGEIVKKWKEQYDKPFIRGNL